MTGEQEIRGKNNCTVPDARPRCCRCGYASPRATPRGRGSAQDWKRSRTADVRSSAGQLRHRPRVSRLLTSPSLPSHDPERGRVSAVRTSSARGLMMPAGEAAGNTSANEAADSHHHAGTAPRPAKTAPAKEKKSATGPGARGWRSAGAEPSERRARAYGARSWSLFRRGGGGDQGTPATTQALDGERV